MFFGERLDNVKIIGNGHITGNGNLVTGDNVMRIILEDGSSHEVSKTDQWKIVYGELLVNPRPIPRRMKKIWDRPPTYAPRLVRIDCLNLAPGQYVMTTLGPKLIREIIRHF